MEKTIKIGVWGCGRIAQHYHQKVFPGNEKVGAQVVAYHDIIVERAEKLAQGSEAKVYTDSESFLSDSNIDLVVVLTPSGLHFEHTKAALLAGRHVWVEKPPSLIPAQVEELERLSKELNLMCCVAFQNRLNPSIQVLRQALKQGRFGKIVTASIRLRWCRFQPYYEDGWHGTWAMDGGVINQQAIHHVDALNWLCGPIDRVCASQANRLNQLEAEDTMTAVLQFHNCALGTIEVTTAARPKDFEASISIVGEGGMVMIGGIGLNEIVTWNFVEPQEGDASVPEDYSQEVENGYGWSHIPLLQQIVERLQNNNTVPPISLQETVETVQLIHALYSSVEQDGWVDLQSCPESERLGKR